MRQGGINPIHIVCSYATLPYRFSYNTVYVKIYAKISLTNLTSSVEEIFNHFEERWIFGIWDI